ncbi:MAG TPA: iron dependent repressor, metal binding and dimerization domain protein [Acidobacteriota bacterium]|nr:iron dependent repressor, metal binding and dimerization domain protein [Acidobacteriota bacterium]
MQIVEEDALLWAARNREGAAAEIFTKSDLLSGLDQPASRSRAALTRLKRAGFIARRNGGFVLTAAGRNAALDLLRRHRLYESYLGDIGYPTDHIHESADRGEHFLTPGLAKMVESEVGERDEDPQGKPIPSSEAG